MVDINRKPQLSLDMDGVLTASKDVVFDVMDVDVNPEDMESWDWPIEQFGADKFLGAFDTTWSECWMDVEPREEDLAATVSELQKVFEVNVVTAHSENKAVREGKQRWLAYHDIPHNEFMVVRPDNTKANLRHGAYIDDKPSLPVRVNHLTPTGTPMYLIDHPYNRDAKGSYTRVNTIEEALQHYIWGSTTPTEIQVYDT